MKNQQFIYHPPSVQRQLSNYHLLEQIPDRALLLRVRDKLACHLGVESSRILLTPGSTFAINYLMHSRKVCGMRRLSYFGYLDEAKVALKKPNEFLIFGSQENAISSLSTTPDMVLFIDSPNFFTGSRLSKSQVSIYSESLPTIEHNLLVIDGWYSMFLDFQNIFVDRKGMLYLGSLSKSFLLAGLRLGYLILDKETSQEFEKMDLTKWFSRYFLEVVSTRLNHSAYYISMLKYWIAQRIEGVRNLWAAISNEFKGDVSILSETNHISLSFSFKRGCEGDIRRFLTSKLYLPWNYFSIRAGDQFGVSGILVSLKPVVELPSYYIIQSKSIDPL